MAGYTSVRHHGWTMQATWSTQAAWTKKSIFFANFRLWLPGPTQVSGVYIPVVFMQDKTRKSIPDPNVLFNFIVFFQKGLNTH